jgi:hypothetical protein
VKAETGDAQAQADLGRCYYNGKGVTTNVVESVKWYRKAAEQGNATGENGLGWCYENGDGVTKDLVEAVKWYRKAAEQGDREAQDHLKALQHERAMASTSSNRPDSETVSLTTNVMQSNWTNRITFTNTSGVVSEAEPIRVEHGKLIYRAPGGGGSVKLSELPPYLQERFGYDPAQAAADEQQEKERRARQAQQAQAVAAQSAAAADDEKWRKENEVVVYGKVIQKVGDELLVDAYRGPILPAWDHLVDQWVKVIMAERPARYGVPTKKWWADGTVLLLDYPKISAVVDGDFVAAVSYPMGTYEYTAVSGGRKTVRRYTASLTKALINR